MKVKSVVLAAALAFALFLILPLGSVIKSLKLKKHGVQTESIVTDSYRKSRGLPKVTVTFTTVDGNEVTATASRRYQSGQGNKLMVWYDPADPTKIDFGDTIGYNMRAVIILGLVIIFLIYYFIRYTLNDKSKKKLISSGRKISAEFVSIGRNEKYRMGDKNPWVINCRWFDNSNNKEYFFSSKYYTIDPAPYMKERLYIDVYIEPADPGKYYMDNSFMPKGNNTIG